MRRFILIGLMMLVMATTVSAQTWVDKYYGIDWSQEVMDNEQQAMEELCDGETVFEDEMQFLNKDAAFKEALELFDDGYIVVHFTKADYKGQEYYTAYKRDGKIHWVKSGLCASSYQYYSISTDVESKQDSIFDRFHNGDDIDYISEGYKIMTSVNGLTLMQKIGLLKIAVEHATEWG